MSIPSTMAWSQPPGHTPAYNTVNVRTTLARPQEPIPTPPPPKPRKVEWSPSIREYVQRAFDPVNAIAGIDKSEMEARLRQIISYFAERSSLDHVDWATHPLPQNLIFAERQAVASSANTNPWGNGFISSTTSGSTTNSDSYSPAKKRKSMEEEPATGTTPPWRKTQANRATFEDRISFSDKRQKKNETVANGLSKSNQADLERRRQRFQTSNNKSTPPWNSPRYDSENEYNNGPIIGTCQNLEKKYFRLTAPPKPETVRPQPVLERTLEMLKKKWRKENNYNYICDQFKSLRQDLTVQHIKNAFTVSAYEIHARIALEKGDLGEYNQCQTQLRALYSMKLGGKPEEFLAYRVLYYVYTRNHTDMNDLLAELTLTDKKQPAVKHALDVRSALALGNYHKFFQLYLSTPNMGAYLMDMFIERERLAALANISRAYMNVNVRFLTEELGFESDNECFEFLTSHGAEAFLQTVDDIVRLNFKDCKNLFENQRAASFSKVDIKGQI